MHNLYNKAFMDAAENWQLGFQDPATSIAAAIQDLHNDILFFIVSILVFVVWMLFRTLWNFRESVNAIPSKIIHGTTIEIIWTLTPSLILLIIAAPSLSLLYAIDEIHQATLTLKAIGHQWYWSYEYNDYDLDDVNRKVQFDSYMLQEDDLEEGQLRLIEVDNRVILPIQTHVRLLLTSADVLHSWAVPSLGVKCDAVPGRLNQVGLFIKREGVFFGQCSELCGVNHGFMPIVVEAVDTKNYLLWLQEKVNTVFHVEL